MKRLIVLLMLAGTVGAVDFPVNYGGPLGTVVDSFYVTSEFGGVVDTGDFWTNITTLDTTLSLTGEGLYTITAHYKYQGYAVWVNESFYYNTYQAGSGGGDHDTIFVYDTSGVDALVPGTQMTIKNTLGTILHQQIVPGSGYVIFPTKATDTILVTGQLAEYVFDVDHQMIITGDKRDTLFGYNVFYAAASGKTCNVTVQVYGPNGSPAKNVEVSCVLDGNAADSAGHAVWPNESKKRTDASGNVTFTRFWSSYLIPATDYVVTVHNKRGYSPNITITVPRQATFVVDFP